MIKLTFADIAIQEQTINWSQTSGVMPCISSIIVPIDIAEKILEKTNPVKMVVEEFDTKINNEQLQKKLIFDNLYIIDHYIKDEFNVKINFADVRWLFQGKKIKCAYNVTLLQNGVKPLFPLTYSPLDLRRMFNTISVGRYVDFSVKNDGTPYSIKEIIERELNGFGIKLALNVSEDLSYIIENIVYDGLDFTQVLQDLLRYGRLQITVTNSGELYVYSLNDYTNKIYGDPVKKLAKQYLVGGKLFISNKKNARPRNIKIRFKRKEEILVVANEDFSIVNYGKQIGTIPEKFYQYKWCDRKTFNDRRIMTCYNVVPLPYEETYNNEVLMPGKYVPIEVFLSIYKLSMTMITTQPGYFSQDVLINLIMVNSGLERSPSLEKKASVIAATLKEHFRQTYMLDPYLLQHIEFWETKMCSIASTFDHQAYPSVVYGDYCHIGTARSFTLAKITGQENEYWKHVCFNYNALTDSDVKFTPSGGGTATYSYKNSTSPAVVTAINPTLGIFRISYPTTGSNMIISTKVGPNVPIPSASSPVNSLIQCYPTRDHTLGIIMSIVWKTGKDFSYGSNSKYYSLNFFEDARVEDGNNDKIYPTTNTAKFDAWECISDYDYARYRYIRIKDLNNNPYYDAILRESMYEPLNLNFLTSMASYEAGVIYNNFIDLYVGTIRIPSLFTEVGLTGNLNNISWVISPYDTMTVITFSDYIPYPSLESKIPQKYIDYIRRQIDKGDAFASPHVVD